DWNAKVSLSWFLLLDRRFDEALEIATEFARRFPGHEAYYSIAHIHLREPRLDLAEEVAERATREFPNDVYFHPVLAIIAAMRGDASGLRASVDATLANARAFGHFHHAQYDIGCAYAIAGDVGEAVRWLTDSAHNGNPCAAMIERDPLLASIRDSEELRPLLAELHEQQERYAVVYRDAMTRPLTESQP
ncbi:MAG TPA: tetratricopeptide repeat protein, partial [Thermoanaerobaculia bacterium]